MQIQQPKARAMKLIPPRVGNGLKSSRVRWLWQFLLGAAIGTVVGLAGYLISGDVDWFVAIPMLGILFAVQPLNVIWLLRRK